MTSKRFVQETLRQIKPRYWAVQLMIKYRWFSNIDKFKPGDLVRYSWKAKVYLDTVVRDKPGVFVFEQVAPWSKKRMNCYYTFLNDPTHERSGCDVFWLRKIYWWESVEYSESKFADWLFNTFGRKVEEKLVIGMDNDHTIKKAWVLSVFGRVYTRYVKE